MYCKQNNEPIIPITVRIAWSADGTIKPLMYWTPDGARYDVTYHAPSVPLALLKEGGEGLRFEVSAVAADVPELSNRRFETYIYLAGKMFSEKNIVDCRYAHVGKEYVPVVLDVFPDGDYELLYFSVRGVRYAVERTHLVEPGGSYQAGGIGVRHKVTARLVNADNDDDPDPRMSIKRLGCVYLELDKWFVNAG